MKPTTDIEQVKSVARALLMTEVYKTPYSPMVVQHPFTSSGFVATTKDGVMQLIDITESEENLQAWQSFMRKQINSTDNAYEIYMMTNKPYAPIKSVTINGKAYTKGQTIYTIDTANYTVEVVDAGGNKWTTEFRSTKKNVLTDTLQKEYYEIYDVNGDYRVLQDVSYFCLVTRWDN